MVCGQSVAQFVDNNVNAYAGKDFCFRYNLSCTHDQIHHIVKVIPQAFEIMITAIPVHPKVKDIYLKKMCIQQIKKKLKRGLILANNSCTFCGDHT